MTGNIEVTIHDLGHKGEGVGRHQGQVVFVPGALPGDVVLARPFAKQRNFQRADLVELISPSPQRVTAPCSVFPRCGGCQIQDLAYEAQLAWKQERVVQSLRRVGGIEQPVVQRIIPSAPWGYRNKAQFPVQVVDDRLRLGFYEAYSHRLVPVTDCLIQHPAITRVAAGVEELLGRYPISAYDETTGRGLLRHVVIRSGFASEEVLVGFVAATDEFAQHMDLCDELVHMEKDIVGIVLNVNDERGNRILGPTNKLLWGRDYLQETLTIKGMPLHFRISLPSFFQVNPLQAENLYGVVLEYAGVDEQAAILDAYCGTGGIALALARAGAKNVWGIDVVAEAIVNARENASRNGLDNVEFHVGRVEEKAAALVAARALDTLVVDPPRAGLPAEFLCEMAAMEIPQWIYVSCNPVTLGRDIKLLASRGYRLRQVQPVDMFPHTAHIECVAQLSRI